MQSDPPRRRLAKLALFCLLAVLHAAILLLALHSTVPLPLFGCDIGGETPVHGDLFDHMRDAPDLGAAAP